MLWAVSVTAQQIPTITFRTDTIVLDRRTHVSPLCHLDLQDAIVHNNMAYYLFDEISDCVNSEALYNCYFFVTDLATGKTQGEKCQFPFRNGKTFQVVDGTVMCRNEWDTIAAYCHDGRWEYREIDTSFVPGPVTIFRNDIYHVDYLDLGEWGHFSWVWHIPTNKHLLYPTRLFSPICLGDTLYMVNQAGIFYLEPNLIGLAKKGFCSADECRDNEAKEDWWFLHQFYGNPDTDDEETQHQKYLQLKETCKRNFSDTIGHSLLLAKYPAHIWDQAGDTTIHSLCSIEGHLCAIATIHKDLQVDLVQGQHLTPLKNIENLGVYCKLSGTDNGSAWTLRFQQGKFQSTILHIQEGDIRQIVVIQIQDTLKWRMNDSFDTILAWIHQNSDNLTSEQIHKMETSHGSASDRIQWHTYGKGSMLRSYYQNLPDWMQNKTTYYLDSTGKIKSIFWYFANDNAHDILKSMFNSAFEAKRESYIEALVARITQVLGKSPKKEENGDLVWQTKEGTYQFNNRVTRLIFERGK